MILGRALTPQEAQSGKYRRDQVVRYGKGLYLKAGAETPPPAPIATPSPAEAFASAITSALPAQSDIPSFDASGLYDPNAAQSQYEQYYGPYNQRQVASMDEEKRRAREQLLRTIQATRDSAAVGEQTGSGAAMKAEGLANEGFQQSYEVPLSDWQTRLQNLKDTQGISRYDFINKLKDEAYQRYLERYRTQPSA
jgi:hypothetical protein